MARVESNRLDALEERIAATEAGLLAANSLLIAQAKQLIDLQAETGAIRQSLNANCTILDKSEDADTYISNAKSSGDSMSSNSPQSGALPTLPCQPQIYGAS